MQSISENSQTLKQTDGWQLIDQIGHVDAINEISFSPDGSRLLSASNDKTVRVWDACTGACLKVLRGHTDSVTSASFSPDGNHILTASHDESIRIWNGRSGELVNTLVSGIGQVFSAMYSCDGSSILTVNGYQSINVWDSENGNHKFELKFKSDYPEGVIFSPDGKYILTFGGYVPVTLWDAKTGSLVSKFPKDDGDITSARMSPTGDKVVTINFDGFIKIWSVENNACLSTIEPGSNRHIAARFSVCGSKIITGSDGGKVNIWDAHTAACIQSIDSSFKRFNSLALSDDGETIAVVVDSTSIETFKTENGSVLMTTKGHGYEYRSLIAAAISSNGKRLATHGERATLQIWDAETGSKVAEITDSERVLDFGHRAAFSPDGTRLVTSATTHLDGIDWIAQAWDLETGTCLKTITVHTNKIISVAISPDGQQVITSDDDKMSYSWSVEDEKAPKKLKMPKQYIKSIAFSPDGKFFITGSMDAKARIWDTSGKCVTTLEGHEGSVESVEVSPNGTHIVTGGLYDRTAKIWDFASGELLFNLTDHTNGIVSMAFSQDSKLLATKSASAETKLWTVADGQCQTTIYDSAGRPDCVVAFTENGSDIITAGYDYGLVAKVYNSESGELVRANFAYKDGWFAVSLAGNIECGGVVRFLEVMDGVSRAPNCH